MLLLRIVGLFVTEIITESLKTEKKEKTEKIEDVANDVDAKKKAEKPPAGKEAKKEADKKEAEPPKEAEKPKGDPPLIDGKLEDVVS